MQLISIGIREAKVNLSKILKDVQRGAEIVITDRGKPVGKIVPVPEDSLPLSERIKQLESRGIIEPVNTKKIKRVPPPLPLPDGMAQKFLEEGRAD
jgi:prevent-host-death family protein